MRFPYVAQLDDILVAWTRMVAQYERDYETLRVEVRDFTLDSGTTATIFYNEKIRPTSAVVPVPTTANAASGVTALYHDTPTTGQVTWHHANAATGDRIYRIVILGE